MSMEKEKKIRDNQIGNVVAIVGLTILALTALWNKTPLETPPAEVKIVYYDTIKLPGRGENDKLSCAYSHAPVSFGSLFGTSGTTTWVECVYLFRSQ